MAKRKAEGELPKTLSGLYGKGYRLHEICCSGCGITQLIRALCDFCSDRGIKCAECGWFVCVYMHYSVCVSLCVNVCVCVCVCV